MKKQLKERLEKMLSLTLALALAVAMFACAGVLPASAAGGNPTASVIELPYTPGDTARSTYNFQWGYASENPKTVTRVNSDGTLSVCVEPASSSPEYPYVYIYELDKNHAVAKTLKIEKKMPRFGSFIKDDSAYYIFTVKTVTDESDKTVKNMSLDKYDLNGKLIKSVQLNGDPAGDASADNVLHGIKEPIHAGNCTMVIAGSRLAVYFGRLMYVAPDGYNHQASYGFVFNKDTFVKENIPRFTLSYASHSFDQFLLADGNDIITVDRGDAYPRGFMVKKIDVSSKFTPFTFKGDVGFNPTFSELGGLVKTSSGYLLAGTYENKNPSDTTSRFTGSRNLFVQTVSSGINSSGTPIYLTDYNDKANDNVVFPKLVKVGSDRNLLMWELFDDTYYKGTYYAIVSDSGKTITAPTQISDARLNMYDPLEYNAVTGKVYWTSNVGSNLVVYEFDPNSKPSTGTGVAKLTVKAADGTVLSGAKITLDSTGEVFTVNADVHSMELPYGLHDVTVEREGYATTTAQINVYAPSAKQDIILAGADIGFAVRDGDTGDALSDVIIHIQDGTIVPPVSAGSSFYALNSKPAGFYTATFEKSGYLKSTFSGDFEAGSSGSYWVKNLFTSGPLSVKVTDTSGKTITGKTVVLDGEITKTDPNSSVSFSGVTAGNHTVSVSADGYEDITVPFVMDTYGQVLNIVMKSATESNDKLVIMKKEQIKAYVDGQLLPMTDYGNGNYAMAKSVNGSYALPLRCIGEAFDMRVDYLGSGETKLTNAAGDYVVVKRDSTLIEKYSADNTLVSSFTADFATFTDEAGITYVPMRAVSEALGLGVSYVGSGTTGHGSYVAVSTDLFLNLKPDFVLEEIEKAYALGL